MSSKQKRPPQGQIRASQLVTTFGPGAMVDLPNQSVVIGGLEYWQGDKRRIHEERLEKRLAEELGVQDLALYAPPVDTGDDTDQTGVFAYLFPCWFVAEKPERVTVDGRLYRRRPLIYWTSLDRGGYLTEERKRVPVVPVRFVQGCKNGHLSDIDWPYFAHNGAYEKGVHHPLFLEEGGTGGDLADIYITCGRCRGARRMLGLVKEEKSALLGYCQGHRPWLGPKEKEAECLSEHHQGSEKNRLLVRSASNAYFGQVLSVISIPDQREKLRKAVDDLWEDELQYEESLEDLTKLRRKKPRVEKGLNGFSTEDVWEEITRRRLGCEEQPSIKQVEFETLMAVKEGLGEDIPDGDFYAQARPHGELPGWLSGIIKKVVLVHRLREVSAQVGFTRFEPVVPDLEGELEDGHLALGVKRAPLSKDQKWLPAMENRGEGVFIGFAQEAIDEWLGRKEVQRRADRLLAGHQAYYLHRKAEKIPDPLGLPYLMLHSLAHLLITAVSLECGYSASSIRERIYAGKKTSGYGILLYTGSPGSEGTLGGLVQVGRKIEDHLRAALELGRLCSSDPICAQHDPANEKERRFLHGAACHGCLLIAETSCERRNEYLDRALVVHTVEGAGAEFFRS